MSSEHTVSPISEEYGVEGVIAAEPGAAPSLRHGRNPAPAKDSLMQTVGAVSLGVVTGGAALTYTFQRMCQRASGGAAA